MKPSKRDLDYLKAHGHRAAKMDRVKGKDRVAALLDVHGVSEQEYRTATGSVAAGTGV